MGGVLVTSRDPPSLQVIRDPSEDITKSLLLTGERDRILHVITALPIMRVVHSL
jgi:hypothetical protein